MTKRKNFLDKIKTLDELDALIKALRSAGKIVAGVTSGAYDIVHSGHSLFLQKAADECDFLIVIIASDRTVTEDKGPRKPYVTEVRRAEVVASIESVDAVIISDEKYHETILQLLKADKMFKGGEYREQTIYGSELVGEMVFIEGREEEFHSSDIAHRIRTGDWRVPRLDQPAR